MSIAEVPSPSGARAFLNPTVTHERRSVRSSQVSIARAVCALVVLRSCAVVCGCLVYSIGEPQSWRRLRVALRATMGYIWRTHMWELRQYPWRLMILGDKRQHAAAVDSLMCEWNALQPCCVPEGLARRFKLGNVQVQDQSTKALLYWIAYMHRLTVADVETRHARNSHSASSSGHVDFITSGIAILAD